MKIAQNKDGTWILFSAKQAIFKAHYVNGRCGDSYHEFPKELNDVWVNTDDPGYFNPLVIGDDIEVPEMFNGDADAFVKDLHDRYGWKLIYWNDEIISYNNT